MKKLFLLFIFISFGPIMAQANFSTSLHGTRDGKSYWYNATNGGFEAWTNVPIGDLGCKKCHGATNADGVLNDSTYTPGCVDCHPSNSAFNPDSISQSQCLTCHGRELRVISVMQLPDVHRTAGMVCWDCHTSNDMHGTADKKEALMAPGAIEVDCVDCHIDAQSTPPLPDHASTDPHNGKLHCTSCHMATTISCYNCHFESIEQSHLKRPYKLISDFVLLINRDKDNKVHPATFQSITNKGDAFVAIAPNTTHTIVGTGARTCGDCHNNMGTGVAAIQEYNSTGKINFTTWNDNDSTLSWIHGVVPFPEDYKTTMFMDYITYNGNTSDPLVPSKNWSKIGKNQPDGHQLFFGTPLTKSQMGSLGFDTTLTDIGDIFEATPTKYDLNQNYPNPFNPSTKIRYSLSSASQVVLKVYNTLGEEIKTLVNAKQPVGSYTVNFSGEELSSGVYFCTLKTDSFSKTIKMMLLK